MNERSHYGVGWLRAAVGIVTSPGSCFAIISERRPWVGVLTIVSVATIAQGLALAPSAVRAISASTAESGVGAEGVASALVYAGLALSPVLVLAGWLLDTMLVWLMVMALGGRSEFRRAFSLTAHLGVINSVLGGLARLLILAMAGGAETGADYYDAGLTLGLDLLVSTDSGALRSIYSRVNPFSIWCMVLTAYGAMILFRLTRWKSWTVAACQWSVSTAVLALSSSVSEVLSS